MRQRLTCPEISAVLVALAAVACGGTTVTELTGPGAIRCATSIATPLPTVPAGGTQLTTSVVAARECVWTVDSRAGWIEVSPASGQGEAQLTIVVAANTQQSTRSAAITVNGQQYTLTQEAAPRPTPPPPPSDETCVLSLTPPRQSFTSAGGTATVDVVTRPLCPWSASSSAGWITITSGRVGLGSSRLVYQVGERRGRSGRTATIRIGGHTHEVTQNGRGNGDDD